jgi:hypothetical protein
LGVVKGTSENQVSLPYAECAKLVFSGDIITGNTVTGDIIGKVSTLNISVAFDTSHSKTIDNLVTALNAEDGVSAVYDTTDVTKRTVLITVDRSDANFVDIDAKVDDWIITGGDTQATIADTYYSNDSFVGISRHEHKMAKTDIDVPQGESNQIVKYWNRDAINVVDEGILYVQTTESVNTDDIAYLITSGVNRGKFCKSSSSTTITTTCKFKQTVSGVGISQLKIRQM